MDMLTSIRTALAALAALGLCGLSMNRAAGGEIATVEHKEQFMVVTDKGEIVSWNLREMTFRKELSTEPVRLKWADVRSVNGAKTEAVLERYRKEAAGRICPDCKGGAELTACAKCKGVIAEKMRACSRCAGTGTVACGAAGCDKGMVPCPGPCVKWGVGRWEKWPDDGSIRRIWEWDTKDGKHHMQGVSRGHIGQVFEIKDGQFVDKGICTVCNGKAVVPCKACSGTGKVACPRCGGSKEEPDPEFTSDCPDCVEGIVPCAKCKGLGLLGEAAGSAPPAEEARVPPAEDKPKEKDPNAIYLKDGRVVKGKVVMRTDSEIIVKTETGKLINIPKAEVESAP